MKEAQRQNGSRRMKEGMTCIMRIEEGQQSSRRRKEEKTRQNLPHREKGVTTELSNNKEEGNIKGKNKILNGTFLLDVILEDGKVTESGRNGRIFN